MTQKITKADQEFQHSKNIQWSLQSVQRSIDQSSFTPKTKARVRHNTEKLLEIIRDEMS